MNLVFEKNWLKINYILWRKWSNLLNNLFDFIMLLNLITLLFPSEIGSENYLKINLVTSIVLLLELIRYWIHI